MRAGLNNSYLATLKCPSINFLNIYFILSDKMNARKGKGILYSSLILLEYFYFAFGVAPGLFCAQREVYIYVYPDIQI